MLFSADEALPPVVVDQLSTSSHTATRDLSATPSARPRKRRTPSSEADENDLLHQASQTLAAIRDRAATATKEDNFDKFGSFVAAEMRLIKNKKRITELKKSICNAILDAQADDSD